jgi:pimeloyl-ACP methyl ester carboxylesterase
MKAEREAVRPLETSVLRSIRFYDSGEASNGERRPIVLLHGLGNSLGFWTGVAPEVAAVRRVVALDIPGFGLSDPLPEGGNPEQIATVLSSLLSDLGIESCTIVGHSMGGIVALHHALHSPELVRRIVLVDACLFRAISILHEPNRVLKNLPVAVNLAAQFIGAILPLNGRAVEILARNSLLRQMALWPFVKHPTHLDPPLLAEALRHNGSLAGAGTAFSAGRSTDLRNLMASVTQPVDIVWGAQDRLMNVADVEIAERVGRVAEKLSIPDCGHWPMLEKPRVLAEFLRDESDR